MWSLVFLLEESQIKIYPQESLTFFSFETPINKWGKLDWWYGPYLEVKFHGDMKQSPCQPAKDPIASRWDLWFWNEISVFMETSVQRIDQAGMCPNLQPKVKDKLLQSLGSATWVGLVSCNRFPLVSCFDCRLRKHEWLLRPKAHASWLFHVCSSIPNQLCCWSEEMKKIKTWHRWETAYLRYIDQMNKPENSIFFWLITCKPCACTRRYITWSHIAKRTVPWPLQTMA